MALKMNYKTSPLSQRLDRMAEKTGIAVLMLARTEASRIEGVMKRNRPWTDRTGMAKASLRTTVSQPNLDTIRITLAHGVSYGKWLELAHSKRYAIIAPTLNAEAPNVMQKYQGLMVKIVV